MSEQNNKKAWRVECIELELELASHAHELEDTMNALHEEGYEVSLEWRENAVFVLGRLSVVPTLDLARVLKAARGVLPDQETEEEDDDNAGMSDNQHLSAQTAIWLSSIMNSVSDNWGYAEKELRALLPRAVGQVPVSERPRVVQELEAYLQAHKKRHEGDHHHTGPCFIEGSVGMILDHLKDATRASLS